MLGWSIVTARGSHRGACAAFGADRSVPFSATGAFLPCAGGGPATPASSALWAAESSPASAERGVEGAVPVGGVDAPVSDATAVMVTTGSAEGFAEAAGEVVVSGKARPGP